MSTLAETVLKHQLQIDRLVSDAESEKHNRVDMNKTLLRSMESLSRRVNKLEWLVAVGVGIIVTLQVVLIKH